MYLNVGCSELPVRADYDANVIHYIDPSEFSYNFQYDYWDYSNRAHCNRDYDIEIADLEVTKFDEATKSHLS